MNNQPIHSPEIIKFSASLINHGGKKGIMMRRIITEQKQLNTLINNLVKFNKVEFNGVMGFQDRVRGIQKLKKAKIIK